MPKEPKLSMLPDSDIKLSGNHFRKVVRRIECTVPLSGYSIKTEATDEGIKINFDGEKITLNVCSNGSPSTIIVYSEKAPTQ